MKKIFMTFSAVATFSAAVVLTSCNNAEQVKKQVEEQNSKIQTAVDEKLNGLNEEVNAACTATVDSLANVAYAAWEAEEAKANKGKKPVVKKPAPKKPETVGNGKPKMGGTTTPGTVGNGKPAMGNTGSTGTVGNGKPKMGGGK